MFLYPDLLFFLQSDNKFDKLENNAEIIKSVRKESSQCFNIPLLRS